MGLRAWYRENAQTTAELRADARRLMRKAPVALLTVPFGIRHAILVRRHWDDERVQLCRGRDSGLYGALYGNLLLLYLVWAARPELWVVIGVGAWAVVGLLLSVVPRWTAVRFSRISAGRLPGEDPDSSTARFKAQRYWDRALADAELARTGKPGS